MQTLYYMANSIVNGNVHCIKRNYYVFIQLAIKTAVITSIVTTMSWAWIYIINSNSVIQKTDDHSHVFD